MKVFDKFKFDLDSYKKELKAFKKLLDDNDELKENEIILPFFRKNLNLSSQIATINPNIIDIDRIAFEYDIFGDFASDLAIGDTKNSIYCFVEFEEAKKNSLFKKAGKKYKPDFASKLEHGLSQILDWFYKLDGLQNSDSFEERFNTHKIEYEGILIIGRSKYLDKSMKRRLDWRNKKMVINSKHIHCFTFDELYDLLERKLYLLQRIPT